MSSSPSTTEVLLEVAMALYKGILTIQNSQLIEHLCTGRLQSPAGFCAFWLFHILPDVRKV